MTPPDKDAGDDDESMEDILQSIKQIIADDDEDGAPKEASKEDAPKEEPVKEEPEKVVEEAPPEEPAEKTKVEAEKTDNAEDDVPGSEVLELTDVVEDEPVNNDVLSQIDQAVGSVASEEKEEVPAPAPVAEEPPPPPPSTPVAAPGDPMLLSDEADAATRASVTKLRKSNEPGPLLTSEFPDFSTGNTLEAIVCGMIRPMIKEWLDENLPDIVERLVDQEIKRITK